MSSKGFAAGLVMGAVIGAAVGAIADPVKDKQYKRLKSQKDSMFKTIGGILDDMMHM